MGALRRVRALGLVAWLAATLIFISSVESVLPVVQAAGAAPSLSVQAPATVGVNAPFVVTLAIDNASDIGGYETRVQFDTSVADFNQLQQRQNDVKSQGRDVDPLGPIEQPDGVTFGLYSCPLANCLDRASPRHDRGAVGRVQLAKLELVAHRAGTLELRLADSRFVDALGQDVSVQGSATTLRIQVGNGGPLFSAPAAAPRPLARAAAAGSTEGPFNLARRTVVDHADSAEISAAWTSLRQHGVICGAGVDARLDVNHDGCLDVADAQVVANHFSGPGPARPAASQTTAASLASTTPLQFVINSTADVDDITPGDGICRTGAGVCTLRAAIQEANADGGPLTIAFNIPGSGVHSISATGGLPVLTASNVTIDGYTQPGTSPNTAPAIDNAHLLIEVAGPGYTNNPTVDGLDITGANDVVRGLAIDGYFVNMKLIGFGATNDLIVGNFIGTDPTGTVQPPSNPGPQGSLGAGISLLSGPNHNQIGTPSLADRNLISGNFGEGVVLFNEETNNNQIYNNLVGLRPNGVGTLLNTKHGIGIKSMASFNTVGGLAPGQRNVVDGSLEDGLDVSHGTLTVENQLIGNYVGTDVTGNAFQSGQGNGDAGFYMHDGPTNNTIANNVFGNNGFRDPGYGGVRIDDYNNWGNRIENNSIGIGSQGAAIPNANFGVMIGFNVTNVTIGPGNVIANNPEGVIVPNTTSTGITITRNSIYNNRAVNACGTGQTGRGIDLAPIDACDPNSSSSPNPANNGILAPTLASANATTVDARTCAGCKVEVFVADASAAPRGMPTPAGEGKTFVGSGVATALGRALVNVSGVSVGSILTATTTDTLGDTSEFSTNITVGSGSLSTPTATPLPTAAPAAFDSFTRTVTNGWGTADVGGTWATEPDPSHVAGAPFAGYGVNGSAGTMQISTSNVYRSAYLTDVSARDVDVTFKVSMDGPAPAGGFLFTYAAMRRTGSGTGAEYLGRLAYDNNALTLQAFKVTQCATTPCTPVSMGKQVGAPNAHFSVGRSIWVHAQARGANPTTLRMRAWDDGSAEPTTWDLQHADSEPSLQGPGSIGVRALVIGTPSQTINFSFDNFKAVSSDSSLTPTPTPTLTATPTFTSTPTNTPTPTITPTPLSAGTFRVNAGGPAYTGGDGRFWQADTGFSGGNTASFTTPVSGTPDSTLYQTERYGNSFGYAFTVPNGNYAVTLKFAELYWTSAGQRVFNVSVDGQQVLTNFDILAQPGVGPDTAVDETFITSVSGGTLTVAFTTVNDNAKIDAIEVVPTTQTPPTITPTPVRVNSGGAAYTGGDGRVWQADSFFSGGLVAAYSSPVAGTADQTLYQTERFGNSFSYAVPEPNGTYTVTLKFAELYWSNPGQRVFNVALNGQPVLTNFDILAQPNTPPGQALDRTFTTTVSNGALTISFTTVTDNAKIDAIDIEPAP